MPDMFTSDVEDLELRLESDDKNSALPPRGKNAVN